MQCFLFLLYKELIITLKNPRNMSVRDLQTKTIKTEEASEFNILRVVNLDEFLLSYQNTSSYYEPPF